MVLHLIQRTTMLLKYLTVALKELSFPLAPQI
ncbi:unnamed protein product [Tuber aestivum]|uniref:Uncharacterized protein n=1 Tax=Tuber aestivum TaxID=59557 RepID=A0A292Q5P1_9PEZI|nr:unnamed protein product [Tuber aestivum]